MQLRLAQPFKSIEIVPSTEELSSFIVLSGPNGSGKSNLLEAIEQGAVIIDGVTSRPPPSTPASGVRLFALGGLIPTRDEAHAAAAFGDPWVQFRERVEGWKTQFSYQPTSLLAGSEELEEMVKEQVLHNRVLSAPALKCMLADTGKRLIDFDVNDFRNCTPLLVNIRDPFSMSVTELFLTYHHRKEKNAYYQWQEATKRDANPLSLSDEQFISRYGPPPWELLSEVLQRVGLDYKFLAPMGSEDDPRYEAALAHEETDAAIGTAQLSSGERTLLALAMSLYTGSHLGESIELPKVLLLDEADASLHPSMIQSMLRVIDDLFCQRYAVKVILTTHSPSTVALAPEEALYVMRRTGSPRLVKATRDQALASLLVGLPTLSIRHENRRPVFVESEYDESCYQELFRLLRSRLDTPLSLEFIASGRGGQGNCEAVTHLVSQLRRAGNLVQGVLDRDDRSGAPPGICFMPARRSLENIVLDPIAIAMLLSRERILESQVLTGAAVRHFEWSGLEAQAAVDYVTSITKADDDDMTLESVRYVNGEKLVCPRFVLDMHGHDWELRLIDAFPGLRQFGKQLKLRVVQRALLDSPGWVLLDVQDLFQKLLEPPQ